MLPPNVKIVPMKVDKVVFGEDGVYQETVATVVGYCPFYFDDRGFCNRPATPFSILPGLDTLPKTEQAAEELYHASEVT